MSSTQVNQQDAAKPLILHAPNVHQGGGRTLLEALLRALPAETRGLCQLDARLEWSRELPPALEIVRVSPTLRGRWQAERRISAAATDETRLLCFHSLPPLLRCRGEISVFVQNCHLIANTDLAGFPWRQRLRIEAERQWFRRKAGHASEFIVQTETMRQLLRERLGPIPAIRVLPLAPTELAAPVTPDSFVSLPFSQNTFVVPRETSSTAPGPAYDFCYVATGEPHKNHRVLIEAWIELSQREIRPSLCLTLPGERFPDLCQWIEDQARKHGLKIANVGYVSADRIAEIYDRSRTLVYPSQSESFGLPLLEAQQHGLTIIAPELDYVRDVVNPDQTFDANSPRSLARAVERSLGIESLQHPPIDGTEFMRRLFAA